jgi:hypothetical protein
MLYNYILMHGAKAVKFTSELYCYSQNLFLTNNFFSLMKIQHYQLICSARCPFFKKGKGSVVVLG